MIRLIAYALLPLVLLAAVAACACLLGYSLLQLTGDILPLDKLISKITQILLILIIFPLKKILQFSWSDLGFAPSALFVNQMFQGLLISLVTLLPVFLILYALDVHVLDNARIWTATRIAEKAGLGLLLALLIALFEEILFRGLLLTFLRQKMMVFAAIMISSLYFAGLHFLKSKTVIAYLELTISSGFQLMAEAFANCLNPAIFSALIALFFVGLFLAMLRSRIPQSLGLCIGCHCGWVWQIKVSKDLFNVNPNADYLFLVSNYDGVIGPLVSVWLALAILVFSLLTKSSTSQIINKTAILTSTENAGFRQVRH